jgi:hypothetical protein
MAFYMRHFADDGSTKTEQRVKPISQRAKKEQPARVH